LGGQPRLTVVARQSRSTKTNDIVKVEVVRLFSAHWTTTVDGSSLLQAVLMLVRCLLNQLSAAEYITDRQRRDFMRDARNTAETVVRQISDTSCSLEQQVVDDCCK